jgi:hypothetical protein
MTNDAPSAAIAPTIANGDPPAWCCDADTRDNVLARRNVLAGLWAGRLMQIPNHMAESYAAAVHRADFCEPGDEDVVDKLLGDLTCCGIAITRDEVRRKLCEFHRQAIVQTRETD